MSITFRRKLCYGTNGIRGCVRLNSSLTLIRHRREEDEKRIDWFKSMAYRFNGMDPSRINGGQAGVIDGPFDWQGLLGIDPVSIISPDKYIITAGSTVFCFAYHPDLIPKERVPRKWEDMLDPY